MSEHDDPGSANLPIGPSRWRSRGYLPHFDSTVAIQHVTFHLADCLPAEALERLEAELMGVPEGRRLSERRKKIDAWIDGGHGSQLLRDAAIAGMVEAALLSFDGQRYRMFAWCVMPNHVHVLFAPLEGWTMAKIVASWKKFTARGIRDYQRSVGAYQDIAASGATVWHREYWDRFIRDQQHFEQVVD